MTEVRNILNEHRIELLDIFSRHGARHVRVFGSVARGEDDERSDVDFLVELEPGRGLFDLIRLEDDVERLLHRPVDVVTEKSLSPYLRDDVLSEAVGL